MDSLPTRFSEEQLHRITNQALIYMCACPAQVAREILSLRELYRYQQSCLSKAGQMDAVHARIARATADTHAEFERCLDEVLDMEGWDRTALTMPAGLRKLREQAIDNHD